MSAVSVAIIINSPASTSVTFSPGGPFTAPVAIGTVLGTFTIAPAFWSGPLVLSGVDLASFSIVNNAGTPQLEAAVVLSAREYFVTVTATP